MCAIKSNAARDKKGCINSKNVYYRGAVTKG